MHTPKEPYAYTKRDLCIHQKSPIVMPSKTSNDTSSHRVTTRAPRLTPNTALYLKPKELYAYTKRDLCIYQKSSFYMVMPSKTLIDTSSRRVTIIVTIQNYRRAHLCPIYIHISTYTSSRRVTTIMTIQNKTMRARLCPIYIHMSIPTSSRRVTTRARALCIHQKSPMHTPKETYAYTKRAL